MRALWLALAGAAIVAAQSTGAELSGVIRDPAGLVVPGVSITGKQAATSIEFSGETGPAGEFHFIGLPPGLYRITASQTGFAALSRDVVLRVGEHVYLDLQLTLILEQRVSLDDRAVLAQSLELTRGTASFGLEEEKVVTLPLNGRNFVPLLALAPGVNLPPGGVLPRINGSRPRTSEYIYDGISVLQPEPGQVAFYPVVDAIEELRVETNSYPAEYGRSNGGVILVNQKSGTNAFRATLFEFFRHEKLNVRNLFASSGEKPRFRRNQYGFAAGGPLQRNKTFFFGDFQGTRQGNGTVRVSTVPLLAERGGLFATPVFDPASAPRAQFPGNQIPLTRFDAAARDLLLRYPTPTSAGTANNFRRSGTENSAQDQFDLRLDGYLGTRHRVFGRYSYLRDDSRPVSPLPEGSGNITSGVLGDTLTRANSIAIEHDWTISPAAVNTFRFGYTDRGFARSAPGLSVYDVAGYQQLGPPANSIGEMGTSVTQLVNILSWLAPGGHSMKAGADIRLQHLDARQPPFSNGQFLFTPVLTAALTAKDTPVAGTGSSFASFLLGQVARYQIDVQPEVLKPRATIAEFFLQDDWRATSRLSVNLGVRYTLNFPSTVEGNRGAVFNLDTQRLDYLGVDGYPRSARNLDKTNFGPRAGLALRLTDSTALRAGYGLTWIEQSGITTPFTTPLFPFIQNLRQQTFDNVNPAFVLSDGPTVKPRAFTSDAGLGQGVFATQRDNGSGYAQQWNLSLQKTLGESWSTEIGYLGSKLTRLGVPDVNLNQLTAEQLALGPALLEEGRAQSLRPYPRFNTVALYRNNVGHSTYHSLQARLERRFSRGLLLNASYTLSRLIDDAGAVFDAAILSGPVASFSAADSHNRRLEKDVSTGNVPHIFSAGFVYDLPLARGWQVAGVARKQAGSPIPVTQATNLNAFAGFGIQRPNRTANPALPADQRSTARWFDTDAFAPAAQFTLGNSSRNPVIGPGYGALDLMIGKTFAFSDGWRIELRAEAFNVTNTPALGAPNGSFGAPAFGSITTAGDPRVFEFVVKLHF